MALSDDVLVWATGWTRARGRGLELHHDFGGGRAIEAEVVSPSRQREWVLTRPTAEQFRLGLARVRPDVWLSVVGEVPDDVDLPEGVAIYSAQESLMKRDPLMPAESASGAGVGTSRTPGRFRVQVEEGGSGTGVRLHVEVRDGDGSTAAEGWAASSVLDGGAATVVFDRIATDPAFRRQGWGSRVMRLLTETAATHGAEAGLLIASVEGQRLYERLGWRHLAPVTIFYAPTA